MAGIRVVRITVVGIGADGWEGLTPASRHAISDADVLVGSPRQLGLVPRGEPAPLDRPAPASGFVPEGGRVPEGRPVPECTAERVVLPSPLLPNLPALLDSLAGRHACFLASGDPMHHGIGATLVRLLGAEQVRVLPHVSSVSLACARLGWPVESVQVVNLVGRPSGTLAAALAPGHRVLVLGGSLAEVARLLRDAGFGPSEMTVLADLGAATESVRTRRASDEDARPDGSATPPANAASTPGKPVMPSTPGASRTPDVGHAPLRVIAIECAVAPGTEPLPLVPGLPDTAYESDGQLTKREIRAVTLSRLAPLPGALLWDVGAGAGSVAIEWMRTHPSCRAVAIEHRADRAERLRRNAETLGVPALRVVQGKAPDALAGLPAPDAVFVGGGATVPGMIDACWEALRPGGRLVVNAVTLESEAVVADRYARHGGDLVRLSVQRASPVGGFTGWRPAMPVTIWSTTKPAEEGS